MITMTELERLIGDSESVAIKKEKERLAILESRLSLPLCLWGAGVNGRKWARLLAAMGYTFRFTDRDERVWGKRFEGIVVESWDSIKSDVGMVLVSSSKFYEEVKGQLGGNYEVIDFESFAVGNYRECNLLRQGVKNKDSVLERTMWEFYNGISKEDYLTNPDLVSERLPLHLLFYMSEIAELTLNRCEPKICHESNYYRHQGAIMKYAGLRELEPYELPSARVFHGEMFQKRDCKLLEGMYICFGANMKNEIREIYPDTLVFPIGAYILYADSFYDAGEFSAYKQKLGKNLLVYPKKSIEHYNVHFDEREFADHVIKEASAFDSFSVCIRAEDMGKDYVELFRKAGGNIVCAGLRFDRNYLPRQKTMINAADAVLTNCIGTHIPYALALSRPVKFFRQDFKRILSSGAEFVEKTDETLMSALETDEYKINQEILDIYEPYTGIKFFRSPEEIRCYYEICSELWMSANYIIANLNRAIEGIGRKLENCESDRDLLKYNIYRESRGVII